MSNNDFTAMQILLLTKLLHISMHFLHAIPTAWKALTRLANLHSSFTPQIRFTLILEFTTLLCATQLQLVPSYTVAAVTLYYSFKCPSPLFDHEHRLPLLTVIILFIFVSPCLSIYMVISKFLYTHITLYMYI